MEENTDYKKLIEAALFMSPSVIIDPLNFRLRLPPKRKVSLAELMSALDEAMKLRQATMAALV